MLHGARRRWIVPVQHPSPRTRTSPVIRGRPVIATPENRRSCGTVRSGSVAVAPRSQRWPARTQPQSAKPWQPCATPAIASSVRSYRSPTRRLPGMQTRHRGHIPPVPGNSPDSGCATDNLARARSLSMLRVSLPPRSRPCARPPPGMKTASRSSPAPKLLGKS